MRPPRSAGKLHIGSVIYRNGVFSVEFLFECATHFVGPAEMKSAGFAASQNFLRLLHENGFHNYGPPELKVMESESKGKWVKFFAGCKAERGKPKIITIKEPPYGDALKGLKHNGNKSNGSRDKVDE